MIETKEKYKKISVPMHSNNSVNVANLLEEEADKVLASFTNGSYYVRVENGRLQAFPVYEKLPDPIEDKNMLPFWRSVKNPPGKQEEMFEDFSFDKDRSRQSASIIVQHLCGYYYTEDGYKENARLLESYGFQEMRSKRGEDGKYWQLWFLPSLFFAEGKLKSLLSLHKTKDNLDGSAWSESEAKQLERAVSFLRTNVRFGTLDVAVQRLAMPIPGD